MRRTPLLWLRVTHAIEIIKAIGRTATDIVEAQERLKRPPRVMPVIVPGRPEDFGH
jgi:hypothetical protein